MDEPNWASATPEAVLDFWLPEDGHAASLDSHRAFWIWRMRGGADDAIRARFSALTGAAARGRLDHWAATPRGRLALVIALDQFPRSLWRGTPGAYAQDIKAARLVLEGFDNGDYDALAHVWEKAFCLIAVNHCEGPGHLRRLDEVLARSQALIEAAPEHLRLAYRVVEDQNRLARDVIARFGRHPHRNAVLGRVSTIEEEVYLQTGDFPHVRTIPDTAEGVEAMLAARDRDAGAPA